MRRLPDDQTIPDRPDRVTAVARRLDQTALPLPYCRGNRMWQIAIGDVADGALGVVAYEVLVFEPPDATQTLCDL